MPRHYQATFADERFAARASRAQTLSGSFPRKARASPQAIYFKSAKCPQVDRTNPLMILQPIRTKFYADYDSSLQPPKTVFMVQLALLSLATTFLLSESG